MAESSTGSKARIVVVGVGGATCSGKTTLAKHLLQILNPSQKGDSSSKGGITEAFILHQDDFAPPEATLPVNEEFGVTDWDHPPTAVSRPLHDDNTVYQRRCLLTSFALYDLQIDYKRIHRTIEHIKSTGSFPPEHHRTTISTRNPTVLSPTRSSRHGETDSHR